MAVGLIDRPPPTPELTVPAGDQHGRRPKGIIVHQSADLDPHPTVVRRGIPCTDPLRTLVDLGAVVSAAGSTTRSTARLPPLVTVPGLAGRVGAGSAGDGRRGVGPLCARC